MGVKNVFKKSKIFDRDGFYVILFVCLCIVAVAAVYITNNNNKLAKAGTCRTESETAAANQQC